ncbi:hypothetical protein EVAR_8991_1 [Eumeta japonica]|uniref:Uncharacterized protein n=1 Tax=Eumeta variegata TaxID=151549 RepID=A0A4C1WSX5_EUMVA|nr:hypothetical protein EVAR_8991_1 [Eumeta japonica]
MASLSAGSAARGGFLPRAVKLQTDLPTAADNALVTPLGWEASTDDGSNLLSSGPHDALPLKNCFQKRVCACKPPGFYVHYKYARSWK